MQEKQQQTLDEKILLRIPKEIGIVTLVLAAGALVLFDLASSLLVLAGGGTAVAGFIGVRNSVDRFLDQSKPRALKTAVFLYGLRLLLILLVFSIIILFFSKKKIFAFAAGFSSIIVVFSIEAAAALIQMKKWKH